MKSSIRIYKNGSIRATGSAAHALFMAMTEPFEPKGTKFYSQSRKQDLLLVQDESSSHDGWICFRHPDGQWVTLRKATDADLADLAQAISFAHHVTK